MKKCDLLYRNSGRSLAHRITQTAFAISRSNARDAGPWNTPTVMSEEGARLAKLSAPGSVFDIPYASRQRFAVSDDEAEAWRKFKTGDDPASIVPDPLTALNSNEEESEEYDDDDPTRLFQAIDRLSRRSKKRLRGHDGRRSYARDDRGRSYSACTGMIGGVEAWNEAFARGEVC